MIFMSLIFIHEVGHFLAAKLCGWKTDKIELYPYGGMSKFTTWVNTPIKEELFVLVMGPFFQIIGYYLLKNRLGTTWKDLLTSYHHFLLWFNLLPIYPLDGGRLWNLLFSKYLSFYKSFEKIMKISYLTILLLLSYLLIKKSFFFGIVLGLMMLKIKKEEENFSFIFQKFLLERYLYNWNFKKKKVIQKTKEMKKDTYHFFKRQEEYLDEKKYLKSKFN